MLILQDGLLNKNHLSILKGDRYFMKWGERFFNHLTYEKYSDQNGIAYSVDYLVAGSRASRVNYYRCTANNFHNSNTVMEFRKYIFDRIGLLDTASGHLKEKEKKKTEIQKLPRITLVQRNGD